MYIDELQFTEKAKKFIKKIVSPNKGRFDEIILSDVERKIDSLELAIQIMEEEDIPRLSGQKESIMDQINNMAEDPRMLSIEVFEKVPQFLEFIVYLKDREMFDNIQSQRKNWSRLTEEEIKEERKKESKNILVYLKTYGFITSAQYTQIKDADTPRKHRELEPAMLRVYSDVYYLRNEVAHADRSLSLTEQWEYAKELLIMYLDIAGKFEKEIVEENNKLKIKKQTEARKYLKNMKEKYEKKESFKYIELDGKAEGTSSTKTLYSLIKNTDACKIKILGNAGMGKTTTMEYIAYKDASSNRIPVIIELKNVSQENNTIIKIISNKTHLDCSEDIIKQLLEKGSLNLYIDGINEIADENLKRDIVTQINHIITSYPQTKIVLTDRESNSITVTDNVDIYIIEKLTDDKIKEFIKENSGNKETANKVTELVFGENNEAELLREMVRIPFKLYKLIEMVTAGIEITDLNKFDEYFTEAIIIREVADKGVDEARELPAFLKEIISHGKEEYPRDELIQLISCVITDRNLTNMASNEVLTLLVQLGIMEEVRFNVYQFTNSEIRRNIEEQQDSEAEALW